MNEIKAKPVYYLKSIDFQKEIIESIPMYAEMFHDCYFNNYSIVAVNKDCSLKEYKEDTGHKMSALNDAFFILEKFCETCFDNYEKDIKPKGEYELTLLKKMRIVAEDWRAKYIAGSSFLAVDNIHFIVAGFRRLNYPFLNILHEKENNNVCSGMLSLALPFKAFIKIDIYVNFEMLYNFYHLLMHLLNQHPEFLVMVERVEIAKEDFPKTILQNDNNKKPFPTMNIFLKKNIISVQKKQVNEFMRKLENLLENFSPINVNELYTKVLGKNLTIAQGFRNYKKILAYCNLLENVYDRKSNYALIKNSNMI